MASFNTICTIGKRKKHKFVVPDRANVVEHTFGESVIFYGTTQQNGKNYRLFQGIGIVHRISKGDKLDVVYVCFGRKGQLRAIICVENHARRQAQMLKKGQYCTVYGFAKDFPYKRWNKDHTKYGICRKFCFFGKALQGWYVPKVLDLEKEDKEFVEMNDSELEAYTNYIDTLAENDPPFAEKVKDILEEND